MNRLQITTGIYLSTKYCINTTIQGTRHFSIVVSLFYGLAASQDFRNMSILAKAALLPLVMWQEKFHKTMKISGVRSARYVLSLEPANLRAFLKVWCMALLPCCCFGKLPRSLFRTRYTCTKLSCSLACHVKSLWNFGKKISSQFSCLFKYLEREQLCNPDFLKLWS